MNVLEKARPIGNQDDLDRHLAEDPDSSQDARKDSQSIVRKPEVVSRTVSSSIGEYVAAGFIDRPAHNLF